MRPPPREWIAPPEACHVLGRDQTNIHAHAYTVCFTPNQRRVLFADNVRKAKRLGCGAFACAFESPHPDRVVKVTRDSSDVAGLLAAQATGVVPKVYRVFELKQGARVRHADRAQGTRVRAYAIEVERVRPLAQTTTNQNALRWVYEEVEGTRGHIDVAEASTRVAGLLARQASPCDDDCRRLVFDTLETVNVLRRAGINWHDVHAGNVGHDVSGKLKVIDLGISNAELREQPELLAGRLGDAARVIGRKIRRLNQRRLRR